MLRFIALATLLSGLAATAATAQTTQPQTPAPEPAHQAPPATTTNVEGTYVAPGMTGAPKQRVTTDYENRPLKSVAPAKSETSTLSSEPHKRMRKRRP